MEAKMKEKLEEKGLSPTSIKQYMNTLKNLNDKNEIKNLKFLSKPDVILEKIKDYKITTQRNILISIVSVLKNLGQDDLYKKYYEIMINLTKKINEMPTEDKSEAQKKNWLSWSEVEEKFNELKSNIKLSKKVTEQQYNNLLDLVILSLYTLIPPRRNGDYLYMIVTNNSTISDTNKNYLDLKKKQFIFNVYKTSKKDGQLIINIPTELFDIIKKYIKIHPFKENNVPFLVSYDGKPFTSINSITRRLNKIFGKNIGASMLRHIYLSSKYGSIVTEQAEDAKLMSHTLSTQKDYIKND